MFRFFVFITFVFFSSSFSFGGEKNPLILKRPVEETFEAIADRAARALEKASRERKEQFERADLPLKMSGVLKQTLTSAVFAYDLSCKKFTKESKIVGGHLTNQFEAIKNLRETKRAFYRLLKFLQTTLEHMAFLSEIDLKLLEASEIEDDDLSSLKKRFILERKKEKKQEFKRYKDKIFAEDPSFEEAHNIYRRKFFVDGLRIQIEDDVNDNLQEFWDNNEDFFTSRGRDFNHKWFYSQSIRFFSYYADQIKLARESRLSFKPLINPERNGRQKREEAWFGISRFHQAAFYFFRK